MVKIMFVCHGNICRSPMAEFIFKDMIAKKGLSEHFFITSSATSTEEIGNTVHHGTKAKLNEFGISVKGKKAVQLTRKDFEEYDYLLGMDAQNICNMNRIAGIYHKNKVHRLLDFSETPRDIADPWYTGNFDITYDDIYEGCESFLSTLLSEEAPF